MHQHLDKMENRIMTDQAQLDAAVQALTDGLTNIEAEIAGLKSQPAAASLNFTALDAVVARLKTDETVAPAPAPVVVDPVPPVV